jgi:hypothetical protein
MNNSLKIGAISGFIAGFIILGISWQFFVNISLSIGLYESWFKPFLTNSLAVFIPYGIIFGVILGIIYSRVYYLIPGKGILKGLVFGFFLYIITAFRIETYVIPYGSDILNSVGDLFDSSFAWISFGLVLGIFYQLLSERYCPTREETKIITYDMKSGILPGAIAGVLGGTAAGICAIAGHLTGYWGVITAGKILPTIQFWYFQFGHHVLMNMIWGSFFGLIFPRVYNLVPGKKVGKGLCYGLILFLITSFNVGVLVLGFFAYHNAWQFALIQFLSNITSAANAIVFGLVLGYLYRKPSD